MGIARFFPLLGIALVAIAIVAMLSQGSQTQATGFVVTTTADSGPGSFRQALTDAGTNPGLDEITFDPSVFPEGNPATITAEDAYNIQGDAAGQPLTIDGSGAGVIIKGQQTGDTEALLYFQRAGAISGITMHNITLQGSVANSQAGGEGLEFAATSLSSVWLNNVSIVGPDGNGAHLEASETMYDITVSNSVISESGFHGLFMKAESMVNINITGNQVSSNDAVGIEVGGGEIDIVNVTDNAVSNNADSGVAIVAEDSFEPATVHVTSNEVTGNGSDAIYIGGGANSLHVTISQNTTTNNDGLGIDLEGGTQDQFDVSANDVGDGDTGPNDLLNFPVINGVGPSGIVGTACAGCTVELFIADSDPSGHGEGGGYFASGVADSNGDFDINGCGQNGGANVTATATDANGNTSEFALNYILPATPPCPSPTPSPTPAGENVVWGDDNCSGAPDPVDALLTLRDDAGLSTNTGDCPEFGTSVSLVASALLWGDIDCSTVIDPVDALKLLRFDAGLGVSQPQTCPTLGTEVAISFD